MIRHPDFIVRVLVRRWIDGEAFMLPVAVGIEDLSNWVHPSLPFVDPRRVVTGPHLDLSPIAPPVDPRFENLHRHLIETLAGTLGIPDALCGSTTKSGTVAGEEPAED